MFKIDSLHLSYYVALYHTKGISNLHSVAWSVTHRQCATESSLKQTREINILFILYYYKNLDSAFPSTFVLSEGGLLH